MATRPTSDRVREALFSILGDLEGAIVCDLYAGTGALGIEALSRGAAAATFVEQARPALRALAENLSKLDLERSGKVLSMRVEKALATMPWGPEAFDVIFVDPPYAEVGEAGFAPALAKAAARGLGPSVRPGGRLVVEHAQGVSAPAVVGLELETTRTYGDTALSFYLR